MYQPTGVLTKVQASIAAGAIVTILVWLLQQFGGVELPGEVIGAVTVIVSGIVGYITPLIEGEIRYVPRGITSEPDGKE